jgi:hypothetical protein
MWRGNISAMKNEIGRVRWVCSSSQEPGEGGTKAEFDVDITTVSIACDLQMSYLLPEPGDGARIAITRSRCRSGISNPVRNAFGCDEEVAGLHREFTVLQQEDARTGQNVVHLVHSCMRVQGVLLSGFESVNTYQDTGDSNNVLFPIGPNATRHDLPAEAPRDGSWLSHCMTLRQRLYASTPAAAGPGTWFDPGLAQLSQ